MWNFNLRENPSSKSSSSPFLDISERPIKDTYFLSETSKHQDCYQYFHVHFGLQIFMFTYVFIIFHQVNYQ